MMRYHYKPIRMAKIKTIWSPGEKLDFSYIADGNVKMVKIFYKIKHTQHTTQLSHLWAFIPEK